MTYNGQEGWVVQVQWVQSWVTVLWGLMAYCPDVSCYPLTTFSGDDVSHHVAVRDLGTHRDFSEAQLETEGLNQWIQGQTGMINKKPIQINFKCHITEFLHQARRTIHLLRKETNELLTLGCPKHTTAISH